MARHQRTTSILVAALLFGALVVATIAPAAGQEPSTTTIQSPDGTVPDDTETPTRPTLQFGEPPATTTTVLVCESLTRITEDAEAIFIGIVTGTNDKPQTVTYRVDLREFGAIQNPVTVHYVDARPELGLGDSARVRITYGNDDEVLSNTACGATSTIDDDFLEPAVDPLSAIGKSSAKVARRVGRYLLLGGVGVLLLTGALTFVRRMWPLVF